VLVNNAGRSWFGPSAAYLEDRHAGTTGRLTAAMALTASRRDRILAVFAAQAELFAQPDFRASALVAAAPEAPPGSLGEQAADEYCAWILGMFDDLAADAGAANPTMLATPLQLTYDGAGLAGAHGPST
jgi:hypothetical protein